MQFCWRHDLHFVDDLLLWSAPFSCVQGAGTEKLLSIQAHIQRQSILGRNSESAGSCRPTRRASWNYVQKEAEELPESWGQGVCVCWGEVLGVGEEPKKASWRRQWLNL